MAGDPLRHPTLPFDANPRDTRVMLRHMDFAQALERIASFEFYRNLGWRARGSRPSVNSASSGLLPFVGAMSGKHHPRATGTSSARALYLLPLLLATACTHTPVAVCPAIVNYTAEQQTQAANELDALPAGSILPRFMTDYGVLRARLRECQP
jgi:hypothetical protein